MRNQGDTRSLEYGSSILLVLFCFVSGVESAGLLDVQP